MGHFVRATLALGVGLVCADCGVRSPEVPPDPVECVVDADCGDGGHCVSSSCVQCLIDAECGCHQRCDNHACTPLGPTDTLAAVHAHGTWRQGQSDDGPAFVGMCTSEQQCNVGEICNALTGGCVSAADYQTPCRADRPCTEGPDGEALACDESAGLCLPAARCLTDFNCCGVEDLSCDTGAGLCLRERTECTPPTEPTSVCPFAPRKTAECTPGLFCSPIGRCVQCVCSADCPAESGLPRCYPSTGLCVSETYCQSTDDCTEPQMSCDSVRRQCAPRCNDDDDCGEEMYCADPDSVCRPVSERPCEPDLFEPNDDATTVREAGRSLPTPELNGASTVEGLSLCGSDVDWYAIELQRGTRAVVTGISELLSADLVVFAPDGATELASGHIASWGGFAADFTANVTGAHWVSVTRSESSRGYYSLNIALLVGELCLDPLEETVDGEPTNPNDLPAQATSFYDFAAASALLDATACTLEADGDTETVTCAGALLKLCAGDVDYYTVRLPAASLARVGLWNFGGDLDLTVYGPYADDEPADTSRPAGSSTSIYGDEHVLVPARTGGTFLIHVFRASGEPSAYDLGVEVTLSALTCAEDPFDSPQPGTAGASGSGAVAVGDVAGYNDQPSRATWVGITGQEPAEIDGGSAAGLSLCGADQDWFRLGAQQSDGTFTDLPAGLRVVASVQVAADVPTTALTVAAGAGAGAMTAGSAQPDNPARQAVLAPTLGGASYVQVVAAEDNTESLSYGLTLQIVTPPACDLDVLGDRVESRNDAPATATLLSSPPWPGAVGESFVFEASGSAEPPQDDPTSLSLCTFDADWYVIDAPADAAVLASVHYDAAAGAVGLAVLDESVASIATPTMGDIPTQGLLATARLTDTGYVRALGDPPRAGPVYVMVYNRGGWPLDDYHLGVALARGGCPADAWEPNDSWSEAAALHLTPVPGETGLSIAIVDPLSVCDDASDSGSHDWFSVDLAEGDHIRVRAYYDPDQGDLDIDLRGPASATDDGERIGGETDDNIATQDRILEVQHTVGAGLSGPYLIQIKPYGINENHYYLETQVRLGCADDVLEPRPPAEWSELAWSASQTHTGLVLCHDEDWYAIAVPGPVAPATTRTVTVCATFVHAAGDLDVDVFATPPPGAPGSRAAFSHTKTDVERAVFDVAEAAEYYIRVFLDPRDRSSTTYALSVLDGDGPCP